MRIQSTLKLAGVLIVLGLIAPATASAQCYPCHGPRYYAPCRPCYRVYHGCYPAYPCYPAYYVHGHYYRHRCW